jgi:pimeloyl-ACP methyl ester carboxylesterase
VPFASRADAEAFFAARFGPGAAEAWTSGLESRPDGWWPRFDVDVMVRTLRAALAAPSWDEWERIACPALVVRAGNGLVAPETAARMAGRARVVELDGAAHDLHLDRPETWRAALTGFLDDLSA